MTPKASIGYRHPRFRAYEGIEIELDERGASFETALRGLLRMRDFLNVIKDLAHPEERPKSLPQA